MSPKHLVSISLVAALACVPVAALAQGAPPPEAPQADVPPPLPPSDAPAEPPSAAPLPPPAPARADFSSTPPSAESPATEPRTDRWQPFVMSAFLGYATSSLNTGLGLRLGYVSKKRVYVGGAFHYHFGESDDVGSTGFVTKTGVTYFIHQFEMGYAAKAGPVELRPYLGFGPAFGFTYREGYTGFGSPGRTHVTAAISPGLSIAVDLGEHLFLGIDGRPIFFVQSSTPQASFGAIAGARF